MGARGGAVAAFPFFAPDVHVRFAPFLTLLRAKDEEVWLNHSQTFALALFSSNCVLVCHDLQCHRTLRFKSWARWSERVLVNRAKRVVVLSQRDAEVVRRYYHVPIERIENKGLRLTRRLRSFQRVVPPMPRTVGFLGTLARKENRERLAEKVRPSRATIVR